MSARWRALTAGLSVLVLLLGVGGLLVWRQHRPPPDVPARLALTVPRPAPASGTPQPATRSIRLSQLSSADAHNPRRLTITAAHIDGPVVAVGTDPVTHLLRVPTSTTQIAWWAFGSRPGDRHGPVVLAAHVDYGGKDGLFFALDRVPVGATVGLSRADGSAVSYRVVARQHVSKPRLASLGVFTLGGPPRLVLITCGGSFDAKAHSYRDNVVVTARPLA